MTNSMSSFGGFKSSINSKFSMSKTLRMSAQKDKSKAPLQSTMFKTVINPIEVSNVENSPILEVAGSMTESMMIPNNS